MPFDFKKEYREFYLPKAKPEIVTVPCANYIAVRGQGDPNEEGGAYQRAIGVLYAVAYTLKMTTAENRIFAGSLSCACRISSRKRTSTGRSRRQRRRKSSTARKRNF